MYKVQLQNFEGPLDLLLFFIRRDELDIYDIPISKITDEYLGYVKVMEEVNLDLAGEFIYVAAMLISIKAKMLLPRADLDDDGEEIDPRQMLVDRLLEYIKYKDASQQLDKFYADRGYLHTRGMAGTDVKHMEKLDIEESYDVSVFQLIKALKRVMDRSSEPEVRHSIEPFEFTVDEQAGMIQGRLKIDDLISFSKLVDLKSKSFIIATFLAILEMVRDRRIRIVLKEHAEDFLLQRPEHSIDG